jgi:hypothetical protein
LLVWVWQESVSGNIHGMVLSFLMGLGNAREVWTTTHHGPIDT